MWTCLECKDTNLLIEARCRNCGSGRPPSALIGQRISDWIVLEQVGEGGMAVVFKARHINNDQTVAIKVLRSDLPQRRDVIERFRMEALAASSLQHENVVNILDSGSEKGIGQYMILEFLEGADLDHKIEEAPLPTDWILGVSKQICKGLNAAHEAKIIHRDLKPSNIFLTEREDSPIPLVKILDFGIAKMKEGELLNTDQKNLTKTGMLLGTPMYLSPEQMSMKSSNDLTVSVDIYAFGVVLYQMFTGESPVMGDTFPQLMASILYHKAPLIGRYREELSGTALEFYIGRILSKDPKKRPLSIMEAYEELALSAKSLDNPKQDNILLQTWSLQHPFALATGEQIVNAETSDDSSIVLAVDNHHTIADASMSQLLHQKMTIQIPDVHFEESSKQEAKIWTKLWPIVVLLILIGAGWFVFFQKTHVKPSIRKVKPKSIAVLPFVPELRRGYEAYKAKDYLKVIKTLKKVASSKQWKKKNNPHYSPRLYQVLGYSMSEKKRYYGAAFYYKRFLQHSKVSEAERKSILKDLNFLNKVVDDRRQAARKLASQIKKLFHTGHYSKALRAKKELLRIDPSMPFAYSFMIKLLRRALPSYTLFLNRKLLETELSGAERAKIKQASLLYRKNYRAEKRKLFSALRFAIKKGQLEAAKKSMSQLQSRFTDDPLVYKNLLLLLRETYLEAPAVGLPLLMLYKKWVSKLPKHSMWSWMKVRLRPVLPSSRILNKTVKEARRANSILTRFERVKQLISQQKLRSAERLSKKLSRSLSSLAKENPLFSVSFLKKNTELIKQNEKFLVFRKDWIALKKVTKRCDLTQSILLWEEKVKPILNEVKGIAPYEKKLNLWKKHCQKNAFSSYRKALVYLRKGQLYRSLKFLKEASKSLNSFAKKEPKNKKVLFADSHTKDLMKKLTVALPLLQKINKFEKTCDKEPLTNIYETELLTLLKGTEVETHFQKRWDLWQKGFQRSSSSLRKARRLLRRRNCKLAEYANQTVALYQRYLRFCRNTKLKRQLKREMDDCYCKSGLPWLPCSKR